MYNPEEIIPKPEMEAMSDEFIQSQIDYFNKLSAKNGYHYGRDYRDEKYRREQMAKKAKELMCEK